MNTIVLAVDENHMTDATLATVRELALEHEDRVTVIHVHEVAYGRFGRIQLCCPAGEGEGNARRVADAMAESGVPTDVVIEHSPNGSSNIARAILVAAESRDTRLVVVCSRGRDDATSLLLGSVAHRLLHFAKRPVLVIPRAMAALPGQRDSGELGASHPA